MKLQIISGGIRILNKSNPKKGKGWSIKILTPSAAKMLKLVTKKRKDMKWFFNIQITKRF